MLLTLEEIKQQCRLEPDFDEEDSLLNQIGNAAQIRTETRINRKLYADEVPDTDPEGLVLPDDIKQAMLLLVGYWYENRVAVNDFEQSESPLAYNWMVDPYRHIPL
ncbi:phage gp6-like head-tail connector protein [Citrobacter braakii]|uniref:head-tail connector protein n=1 Tax=Citrobacter braakii TaxID=57706 RepID=UPI001DB64B04|nr:phage gp6-like head-tail connector protein [Citrobacter braakii]